jgi:tellurite resistance protein
MSATSTKKPTKEKLASFAEEVRKELEFRGQDEVYGVAVEIGYLAAHADGEMDDSERKAIIDAVDILSKGMVIELEVDSIIETADGKEGSLEDQAKDLGARLKDLGQADPGLLFGAFVAQASSGIDKSERKVLRTVGRAAGISDSKIRRILKVVGAEAPEQD